MKIWQPGQNPNLPKTWFYKDNPPPVCLVFDRESWSWWKCETDGSRSPVSGVTTILKVIHKEALLPWGIKVSLAKLKSLLMEGRNVVPYLGIFDPQEIYPLYEEALDEFIKAAKRTDSDILHDAGDVGTDAHDFLENFGKTRIRDDESRRLELLAHFPIDERSSSCAMAGLEFFQRHNVRFVHAERPVYSRSLNCCGTCDAIVLCDSCDDPACCPEPYKDSLTLLDYKSSNGVYPSYLAQTALYAFAYMEEFPDQYIERRFVLKLPKTEGAFQSWHMAGDKLFEQDLAVYKYALGLYRSLHTVEDWMAGVTDKAKEIRKAAEQAEDDARQLIKCDDSEKYKGVRKKKSCNGTDKMCETCTKIYLTKHPSLDMIVSVQGE